MFPLPVLHTVHWAPRSAKIEALRTFAEGSRTREPRLVYTHTHSVWMVTYCSGARRKCHRRIIEGNSYARSSHWECGFISIGVQNQTDEKPTKTRATAPLFSANTISFSHSRLQTGQHATRSVINNPDQLKHEWQWHKASGLFTALNKVRRY